MARKTDSDLEKLLRSLNPGDHVEIYGTDDDGKEYDAVGCFVKIYDDGRNSNLILSPFKSDVPSFAKRWDSLRRVHAYPLYTITGCALHDRCLNARAMPGKR